MKFTTTLFVLTSLFVAATTCAPAVAQQQQRPNIVVIWGDDIGQSNVSAYSRGMMGYQTPNIDRLAGEGMMFTDYYAEQSCTAGRASFLTATAAHRRPRRRRHDVHRLLRRAKLYGRPCFVSHRPVRIANRNDQGRPAR